VRESTRLTVQGSQLQMDITICRVMFCHTDVRWAVTGRTSVTRQRSAARSLA